MDLITLEEVKLYAGINSTTQDAAINNIIPKISVLIKNYCGRDFLDSYNTVKVEMFNGDANYFMLSEVPLKTLVSVEYSKDYGKTYSNLTLFSDYVVNNSEGIVESIKGYFTKSLNGYRISYYGGYASTPEDLKLAAIDLVMYYLKAEMSIKSTRAPGSNSTQIEYILNTSFPAHIRRVLDLYRLAL